MKIRVDGEAAEPERIRREARAERRKANEPARNERRATYRTAWEAAHPGEKYLTKRERRDGKQDAKRATPRHRQ